MYLTCDTKNLENGFCRGVDSVSVDRGPRIRLKQRVIEILKKHKVKVLWEYPDPTGPRVILCPGQHRAAYLEVAQKHLPESMAVELACRKFILSGQRVTLDVQGRVSIIGICQEHFEVKATDVVYVVGAGLWYELWREKDWESVAGKIQ